MKTKGIVINGVLYEAVQDTVGRRGCSVCDLHAFCDDTQFKCSADVATVCEMFNTFHQDYHYEKVGEMVPLDKVKSLVSDAGTYMSEEDIPYANGATQPVFDEDRFIEDLIQEV